MLEISSFKDSLHFLLKSLQKYPPPLNLSRRLLKTRNSVSRPSCLPLAIQFRRSLEPVPGSRSVRTIEKASGRKRDQRRAGFGREKATRPRWQRIVPTDREPGTGYAPFHFATKTITKRSLLLNLFSRTSPVTRVRTGPGKPRKSCMQTTFWTKSAYRHLFDRKRKNRFTTFCQFNYL